MAFSSEKRPAHVRAWFSLDLPVISPTEWPMNVGGEGWGYSLWKFWYKIFVKKILHMNIKTQPVEYS